MKIKVFDCFVDKNNDKQCDSTFFFAFKKSFEKSLYGINMNKSR